MKALKEKPFAKESDLCAAFIAALPEGWIPYNETAGWDILLSRRSDGFQIGVEAKLKFNAHVLAQALEEYGALGVLNEGPDCRAVLVPSHENGLDRIASYIGITVIRVPGPDGHRRYGRAYWPELPDEARSYWREEWHEWAPARRHRLPDYVPDVAAGDSAPLQLTQWKIGALKIAATIELRGYVTRADFKHHGIDHRRWLSRETSWLKNDEGRLTAHRMPDFKAQHPKVYAQIVAEAEKWMPPFPGEVSR